MNDNANPSGRDRHHRRRGERCGWARSLPEPRRLESEPLRRWRRRAGGTLRNYGRPQLICSVEESTSYDRGDLKTGVMQPKLSTRLDECPVWPTVPASPPTGICVVPQLLHDTDRRCVHCRRTRPPRSPWKSPRSGRPPHISAAAWAWFPQPLPARRHQRRGPDHGANRRLRPAMAAARGCPQGRAPSAAATALLSLVGDVSVA